jgi:serine protease Do
MTAWGSDSPAPFFFRTGGAALGKEFPQALRRRLERAVSKTVQVEPEGKDHQGAGVVIARSGVIISAAHVTDGAKTAVVRRCRLKRKGWDVFCRGAYLCDVLYEDKDLDIAVLKMRYPPKGLSRAAIGDSDALRADNALWRVGRDEQPLDGGWVIAVDHQRGVPELKIGMAAGPGASGGPVFDGGGALVAIALKCGSDDKEPNACYALPINVVKDRVLGRDDVLSLIGPIE